MYKPLDLNNWYRKETFEYFGHFDYPFFNVCFNTDITNLHGHCKAEGVSLSHALHFCSLLAANSIEEFRIRYKDDQLVIYDKIDGGATILLEDRSIRFCLYEHTESFNGFRKQAKESEEQVKQTKRTDPRTGNSDVVHYSIIPWVSFTSISHPRTNTTKDSIPKISFGKYFSSEEKIMIPVSIEVNHGLMDGYHLNLFLEAFEERMQLLSIGQYEK
jgi:chloramphenicol O-acetyltransferase type A